MNGARLANYYGVYAQSTHRVLIATDFDVFGSGYIKAANLAISLYIEVILTVVV